MTAPLIETERLRLRAHTAADFTASARLWADPEIVRHIGGAPSSPNQSWQRMLRYPGLWALLGYGYWAVEEKATGAFIGESGLADFKREISPSIDGAPEAGWVIATDRAGRGYATEAVTAILAWCDAHRAEEETVCIIAPDNAASVRVAEKCGFTGPEKARFGGANTLLFRRARGG
ncbi:MAG: GNAT family N-acetyltransferase [Pseudomonadota bacterium]